MDQEERERLRALWSIQGNSAALEVLNALDACERERDEAKEKATQEAYFREQEQEDMDALREDARALAQALGRITRPPL